MIDDMNKKLWITLIILALIIPVILNIIIASTNPLDSINIAGTEEDWVNFWGAYIGAIIGGLITLIPMKRETDRNALNIMINNQENYIKELKSQLGNNICNLNFKPIGDFELPISKNNKDRK